MSERIILGVDEVGRGPYAGPLVVGAVILPADRSETLPGMDHPWIDDLTDSKKLTPKKRELLSAIILKQAPATATGWVDSTELDELGMTAALKLATRRAVEKIQKKHVPFTEVVIDGTINFLTGTPFERHTTIKPKADANIPEVSAASIIAKVARDSYMAKLGKKYPGYGFEKNAGYGTAAHEAAIHEIGITPEHRVLFGPIALAVKKGVKLNFGLDDVKTPKFDPSMTDAKVQKDFEAALTAVIKKPIKSTTKKTGDKAETIVAAHLAAEGHEILARNFKTKFYEIDIVSCLGDNIYFTEVKYRKSDKSGTPLEAVDKKKLEQMQFAAETFMSDAEKNAAVDMDGEPIAKKQPQLAVAAVAGADFKFEDWFTLD